ncbi:coiled-coil domain-containing protein 14 isoform X3 [Psammomys obesus]|uniref:coiled-coil domain-containing protein 14 isoform X3 n=1 Tax=Psammomys obesus TaxID=48139 RepID=UPI0024537207|nr:coiled-coil domain-containing protein 14 isoform X3 [Psammomys obesus]
MYSPIIYQALCEHVQTQMSLMNTLASKNAPNGLSSSCHTLSGSDSQAVPHSGYGFSASTSVWPPQQPSCPLMVHSEVQTDDDNQFGSQGPTTFGKHTDIPRNSFSVHPRIPCALPYPDRAAAPTFQQLSLANWIMPQQRAPKETDLLKCFQTHMSLFPAHGKDTVSDSQAYQNPSQLQPAFLAKSEEKCAKEQTGKATNEEKYLNVHVQDAKLAKNVQQAENVGPIAEKVRIAKCLLGELKALVAEEEDSEVQRLVAEVEACVSGLSAVSGRANVEVEIALALQPLRSENAQLRRQLRILNQRFREQEKTAKALGNHECNISMFSLQSLNMSLQNQLQESLKSQELLQSKNEELLKVIENQRDENKKFTILFKDKEETLLQNKQQFDIEMTRVKIELEEALANEKNSQFKLETAEKENQILGITLRQRDAEVARLRELTSTFKKHLPLSKRISPQPKTSVATTQLGSSHALASKRESKLCAPVACSSQKDAEAAPGNLSRPYDMEDMQLLRKIKEAIDKIPAAAERPKEQSPHHGLSACHGPAVPAKGNIVSDGSFLNSDLMSDWSISSFSTFTSHDEQDFRNGLAALDANIARLQKSLKTGLLEK